MKFVLIAVLLQLCLSVLEINAGGGASATGPVGAAVDDNQLQFGDLIEFPQNKIGNTPIYSHYGIYVGGVVLEGKTPEQNIFEMTRVPPGCRFSTKKGPFTVRNDYYSDPPQSVAGMKVTIEALMSPNSGRCKKYSLYKENCEMVATLVRFGVAMCKQKGTMAEGPTKLMKLKKNRHEASAAA